MPLIGARHGERPGLLRRKAETPVVRRIADQQDRAWPSRAASAIAWRISAEPMPAFLSDGSTASGRAAGLPDRPRPAVTSHSRTVPTTRPPHRARQRPGLPTAAAAPQLLRRFLAPLRAHGAVEQRFARRDVGSGFGDDGKARSPPPRGEMSPKGRGGARQRRPSPRRERRREATPSGCGNLPLRGDFARTSTMKHSISAILHERRSVPQANPSPGDDARGGVI